MRYLHLNPPVRDLVQTHYRMNLTLGGPILVAIMNQAGHASLYLDAEAYSWKESTVRQQLRELKPDIVGMTVISMCLPAYRRAIEWVRSEVPTCRIALGGPHATAEPEETLALGADLVVVGEADSNITALLESEASGIVSGQAPTDLNALPFPDWENAYPRVNTYQGNEPRFEHPEACSQWDRGCPNKCSFCSNPIFNGAKILYGCEPTTQLTHRRRSPQHIASEISQLKERWGIEHLFVYSDELCGAYRGQAEWLMEVCREISPLGVSWKTQGRCSRRFNTLELFQTMKEAGCRAIMFGCESGSQKILDRLHKGTTIKDIWSTLRLSKQAGLKNWTFWMVGAPEETEADLQETERLIRALTAADLIDYKQVTIITPVPGAPLYKEAQSKGWICNTQGRYQYEPALAMPWLPRERIAWWRARLAAW